MEPPRSELMNEWNVNSILSNTYVSCEAKSPVCTLFVFWKQEIDQLLKKGHVA